MNEEYEPETTTESPQEALSTLRRGFLLLFVAASVFVCAVAVVTRL